MGNFDSTRVPMGPGVSNESEPVSGTAGLELCGLSLDHMESVVELLQQVSPHSPEKDKLEDCLIRFLDEGRGFGLVAKHNGTVVGFGSILLYYRVRGGRVGIIEDLAVQGEYQRNGIGRAIVKALLDFARNGGAHKVTVLASSQAIRLYEHLQFVNRGHTLTFFIGDQD